MLLLYTNGLYAQGEISFWINYLTLYLNEHIWKNFNFSSPFPVADPGISEPGARSWRGKNKDNMMQDVQVSTQNV